MNPTPMKISNNGNIDNKSISEYGNPLVTPCFFNNDSPIRNFEPTPCHSNYEENEDE